MRRFRLVLFLCGLFSLMVAAPALAQGENVPVSLEQAIRTARANLSIPPECTVFNSGFEQGPLGSFWQLNWLSPRGLRNVSVNVDACTGEIVSFHSFRAGGEPAGRLPRYSREEVRPVAEALVKRLAPQKWGVLRLEAAPGRSWDAAQHAFIYVRYVNGIPFPENGVRVVVDGNTKEVIEYTLSWTADAVFPAAKGMLPREEALRRYREQVQPHLQYFVPVAPENPERQRPYLVYSLEPEELAVDAFTGKVLTGMTPAATPFGEMFGVPGGGGERAFSPAEQREIEAVGELLPAAKAVAVVRELVPQAAAADLDRSSLNVGGPWQEEKVWQLSFSNKDRGLRIDAVVSAVTGELLHLYVMSTENEEPRPVVAAKRQEAKLDREEARRIAEEFLKKAAPALLPEARCAQCEFFALPYPNPAYHCVYQRYVNGLPCPSNSLSVQVDAVTGEVIGYSRQWVRAVFPPPAEAITPAAALERYLDAFGFEPRYIRLVAGTPREVFSDPDDPFGWKKAEIRLVYALKLPGGYPAVWLDAQSGEFIDYEGNPVAVKPAPAFSDVAGSRFAQEIGLLKEAGVVKGCQGRFRPRDPVTQAELVAMIVAAQSPVAVPQAAGGAPWYSEAYEQARLRGIIEAKEIAPDRPVQRLELARLLVRGLGYRQVAELPELYRLPFADAAGVPLADRGYAALAWGLRLFPWPGGDFGPAAVVKREEAAAAIVRFLRAPRPCNAG
ncbi:S-layer family protein [Thermodesulfitimonas autotrophica]|uniref:S-layer family protein n=1 Tax=Thermodesulfitimonas autotrophica TaxID=1894989 RepID=A0A3N5BP59_9THEO|nr:YcdB/YcdC domain-containing protein [Thermodesulfitimonas autotrophica]RPF49412.1 S-layer family protein [Thermodesulfitimonas autotrophica]